MIERFEESPRRLAEEDSELGSLLRSVLDGAGPVPEESANWQGLCARRDARRRRARALGAGAALTLVAALVWGVTRGGGDALSIDREPLAARSASSAVLVPAISSAIPEVVQRSPAPLRTAPPPLTAQGPPAAPPAATDTSECVGRVRATDYTGAVACYDAIAKGNGVGAELALYEKARLQARALGNPAAALQTLEQHQRRFGSGSLATEVAMTRIELLVGSGRSSDALAAIDGALAGGAGRERAGDLHALRGDLLRSSGDCAGARAEYAAAESAGVHSARLARGRELCATKPPEPSPHASATAETPEASR